MSSSHQWPEQLHSHLKAIDCGFRSQAWWASITASHWPTARWTLNDDPWFLNVTKSQVKMHEEVLLQLQAHSTTCSHSFMTWLLKLVLANVTAKQRSSFLNHPPIRGCLTLHNTNILVLPNCSSAEQLEPGCTLCGEIRTEGGMRQWVNIWMGLGENSRQQREHFHMWLHHTAV